MIYWLKRFDVFSLRGSEGISCTGTAELYHICHDLTLLFMGYSDKKMIYNVVYLCRVKKLKLSEIDAMFKIALICQTVVQTG